MKMSLKCDKIKISSMILFKNLIALIGILTIATQFQPNTAWHLAQTGLREPYRVRHLSLHFSRVFLCITTTNKHFPTLIATNWPGSFAPPGQPVVYPHVEAHANGVRGDCKLIQKAIWTQVDNLERLWVFDAGWSDMEKGKANDTFVCAPKLLVYDLIRNNAEILRIDCSAHFTTRQAEGIVIKLSTRPEPCKVEKYLYFLLPDDTHLLAYDIIEQKWQQRELISRKYQAVIERPFPIKPIDMAFGKHNELLIADVDGKLYATTQKQLKMKLEEAGGNEEQWQGVANEELTTNDLAGEIQTRKIQNHAIELELLGTLLGPSRSMMLEASTGRLFYAVPKYGAIVRSNYHRNMTAEDNEIIYLTPKNIQQLFFGSEGAVWLLTDRLLQPDDRCFGNF